MGPRFKIRPSKLEICILASFADGGDQQDEQRHRQWARTIFHAFDSEALPGGYPNLLPGDDREREAKAFGRNARRLIEAKPRYDADNPFHSAIPLPLSNDDAARSSSIQCESMTAR